MPSYAISTVDKAEREPVIQGKTFHCYRLGISGHPSTVELLQIPSTPAPAVGDVIEGTIEPGKQKEDGSKWPDKLKRTKQPYVGAAGATVSWDPNRSARIERQHSQEMALRFAYLRGGPYEFDQIREWTDVFEADIGSKTPVEPPKTIRDPVPQIPLDRAKSILAQAQKAGLSTGFDLNPTLKAKLTDVGVESGLLGHLNVEQAEAIESFIKEESPNVRMATYRGETSE